MSLDNYDDLADPREHVQNIHDSIELVIQDNDSMCKILLAKRQVYKEMFKVKELLKLIALEVLIRGVREHALWRKHYALPNKSLLKVKQVVARVRRRSEKIHSQILDVGILEKIRKNRETRNSCFLFVETRNGSCRLVF